MDFGARERRRQAEFRDKSTTVSQEGRTPNDDKGRRNGHLLALGYEDENLFPTLRGPTGARAFFAQREIHWWRSSRSGDDEKINGPTRNMASSQIACVNFLLPLADKPEALVSILRHIDGDVREVIPLAYNRPVAKDTVPSLVEFEWVGAETCLEGGPGIRGANTTSADALIVGVTSSGLRRAYLFEWKYVEEYEGAKYLGDGKSGETRRRRYSGLYSAPDSRFNGQVPLEELLYEPFYQLTRLGLLADKMLRDNEFGVEEAMVVVVCPEGNSAYRKTITSPALKSRFPGAATVDQAFLSALRDPAHFVVTSPDALLAAVRKSPSSAEVPEWLVYNRDRYRFEAMKTDDGPDRVPVPKEIIVECRASSPGRQSST